MKKLLAMVLAACTILTLAGCGSSSGSKDTKAAKTSGYPSRSISNIIPFGAGGGTDLWNRALMDAMGPELKQTIVSSNMTGGSGGSVGVNYVWQAPHDGYTLCGTSETPLTIPVMTGAKQTAKDWNIYIAAGSPGVLCINKACEYKDIKSIAEQLKKQPQSISIAGTTGGLWFALAKMFDSYAKVPFKWVSYNGSSTAIKGCVSNETNCVVASAGEVNEYVRSGDLIPVCVMDNQDWEFPKFGKIPAVSTTLPALKAHLPLNQFLGFMVPKDTDPAAIAKLNEAFAKAMQSEKIKKFAQENVCTLYGYTGDKAQNFAKELEAKLCWALYDMGQATYSPEEFGIAKPK